MVTLLLLADHFRVFISSPPFAFPGCSDNWWITLNTDDLPGVKGNSREFWARLQQSEMSVQGQTLIPKSLVVHMCMGV
jgi:hypothetical protein